MNEEKIKKFLTILFNENEGICVCRKKTDTDTQPLTDYRPHETDLWVSLNPLKPYRDKKMENILAYRNLLIEFDPKNGSIDPAEQRRLMGELGVPYSTCVFSGNESYHFVVALTHGLDRDTYEHWFEWLSAILGERNDRSMRVANILTRLPTVIRPSTGLEQEVISLGKRIPNLQFSKFLERFPREQPKQTPNEKRQEFEELYRAMGEVDLKDNWDILNPTTKALIETGESGRLEPMGRHQELLAAVANMVHQGGFSQEKIMELLCGENLDSPFLEANPDYKTPARQKDIERLVEYIGGKVNK